MNASTEIRKLTPSNVRELVQILEDADSWKKLMEIIPKQLDKDNYECNYSEHNPQKYHSEHFRLIERASRSYQRPCSEILLDEWGTSGRVRPSLGHLLHLLKKAEVYRAVDFVAINLLKTAKPQRPKGGPAAHVHVTFLLDHREEIEEVLENVRCDSSDIRNLNNNRGILHNSSSNTIDNNIEVNLPAQRKVVQLVHPIDHEVSDMMKFSHSVEDNDADIPQTQNIPEAVIQNMDDDNVPNISALLHSQAENIPQISALLSRETSTIEENTNQNDLPQISKLLLISALLSSKNQNVQTTATSSTTNQDELPQLSQLLLSSLTRNEKVEETVKSTLLPQISALLTSKINEVPEISALLNSSFILENDLLPQLSALMSANEETSNSALFTTSSIPQNQSKNDFLPQISALLSTNEDSFLPQKIKELLLSKRIDQYALVPQLSALLSSSEVIGPEINKLLSSLSDDQRNILLNSLLPRAQVNEIPQISKLLQSDNGNNFEPQNSKILNTGEEFTPQFSKLLKTDDEFAPQISNLLKSDETNFQSDEFTPEISGLLQPKARSEIKQESNEGNFQSDEFTPQISKLLHSEVSPSKMKIDASDPAAESLLPQLLNDQTDSLLSNQTSGDFVPQISDLLDTPRTRQSGVRDRVSHYENNMQNRNSGGFNKSQTDILKNSLVTQTDITRNTNDAQVKTLNEARTKSDARDRPRNNSLPTPQISVSVSDKSSNYKPQTPQTSSLLSPNVNLQNESTSNELPTLISSPNSSSSGRPQCNSPLPNLSLNTILPHFNYQELELATSSFDETPHPKGRFLGSGAFGSVFLCLGLLEKPTAVKKLHLDGATEVNVNDTITKQFRNEVELLCSYKHDNLLSICGYSCDGPTYCIMYEYISGGALNYRLENHREELNWRDRMRIACGTAEAVAYLHTAYSRQLIHRDIKTANILLDSANKPKLGDFGIIKLSPNKNTTVTTTIIGTSVYMAPECFRSGEVTEKTDTFSFGVVILELLTALPPLDENREARDLITHVEDMCDNNSIAPLLDLSAGSWMKGETNVAEELFKIANRCLGEKKHRPNMVEVTDLLNKLVYN